MIFVTLYQREAEMKSKSESEEWAKILWEWERKNKFSEQAYCNGADYIKFPDSINELKNLNAYALALDLDPDWVPLELRYEIPSEIKKLGLLNDLIFSVENCRIFPALLCKLENLEKLEIFWCDELLELPKEIGQLKKLKSLKIWGCKSLLKIPEELGNLQHLEELMIWNNDKMPIILETITKLPKLSKLSKLTLDSRYKKHPTVKNLMSYQTDKRIFWKD